MKTLPPLYLGLLIGGVLALVRGMFLTRLSWRSDVAAFRRGAPGSFEIWMRPERFARSDRMREIRIANLVGATLIGAAALVIGFDLLREIYG